jgi:hypothetical protein
LRSCSTATTARLAVEIDWCRWSPPAGIGFAPEWTKDLPNRGFEPRSVRGVDLKIGLGVAWNKESV